jgi:RecA-family ATPase
VSDRLEATEAPAVRLYTDAELRSLPAPRWLIDDILPAGGFGMLYGQPETGKSFLAIDWSLCVATGLPWRGHRTRMGGVVYVAAGEGVSGLSQRIDAWKFVHGVDDLPAALFHIQAVNLLDLSDVARFLYAVQMRIATDPELIVLDTLHRCTPGADENSYPCSALAGWSGGFPRRRVGPCQAKGHGQRRRHYRAFGARCGSTVCGRW